MKISVTVPEISRFEVVKQGTIRQVNVQWGYIWSA